MMHPQGQQPNWQQYEFNEAQNAVISKLANRMLLAGVTQIVFGVIDILGSCKIQASEGASSNGTSLFALVLILCGAFTISAAQSFSKIVKTQGWDISHLMLALQSYSRALLVQFIFYVITAVLVTLIILFLLLMLLVFASLFASMTK